MTGAFWGKASMGLMLYEGIIMGASMRPTACEGEEEIVRGA